MFQEIPYVLSCYHLSFQEIYSEKIVVILMLKYAVQVLVSRLGLDFKVVSSKILRDIQEQIP